MTTTHSKNGFELGPGGNKNGLGAWIRAMNDNGLPIGLKAADVYGPLYEAIIVGQERNVQNWLGFRFTRAAGHVSREAPNYDTAPWDDAPLLCSEVIAALPPEFDKNQVWVEIINEPRAENKGDDTMYENMDACDYLGEWCLAAAKFLNAKGYKFMGPSFNSGEPGREGHPLSDAVAQYSQPGMLKYLTYCAENPDMAALSVHEYSWDRWLAGETADDWYPDLWGRFEAAIAATDKAGIPRTYHIFVTEFGFAHDKAPAGQAALPHLEARNRMVARFPQVKYDASWALRSGYDNVDDHVNTWLISNHHSQRYDLGPQPARTHAAFGGTLPGDTINTGSGRGKPRTQYDRYYRLYHDSVPLATVIANVQECLQNGLRRTFGWSADDAGIGDLDVRVIELVGCPVAEQPVWSEWYTEHYPGTELRFISLTGNGTGPYTEVSLNVPYKSQWATNANASTGDCGPAAVAMVAAYYGTDVSVNEAAIACDQPWGSKATSITQLRSGLTKLNVKNVYVRPVSADRLRQEINAGHPTIVLIHYGSIPDRQDVGFTGGHFLVVVGYGRDEQGEYFLVNDSDYWGSRTVEADHKRLSVDILLKAMGDAVLDGNYANQAIVGTASTLPPPPPPTTSLKAGIHASADTHLADGELALFQTARAESVTLLHGMKPADVAGLRQTLGENATYIVRTYYNFGGRNISPDQYVNDVAYALNQALEQLAGLDVIVLIDNEPNLNYHNEGGLGASWMNGAEFGAWFSQVASLIRQRWPSVRIAYPGLSPGAAATGTWGRRLDSWQFLADSAAAIANADVLALHIYFAPQAGYPISGALAELDEYIRRFPNKPLVITEASNNQAGAGAIERGQQYVTFIQETGRRPYVIALTFFVASGYHFGTESWLKNMGIAEIVGRR